MKDDLKNDPDQTPQPQDAQETPEIYAVGRTDGQPALTRRTFLEMTAAAAAAVAASSLLTGGAEVLMGQTTAPATSRPILAHKDPITAMAVNATGKLLVSGDKAGTIKLWQLPEGTLLNTLSGHKSAIVGIAFPKEADTLWTLDASSVLKRWHLPDGKEIPDGKSFAASQTTRPAPAFTGVGQIGRQSLVVPGAGDWYAFRFGQGLEVHSQTTGKKLRSLEGLDDAPRALACTADGRLLLAGGSRGNVALWTPSDGALVKMIKNDVPTTSPTRRWVAGVFALTIAQDGTLAVSSHTGGRLRIWSLPALAAGQTFVSTLGTAYSVAIRPQKDLFVAGFFRPDIGLWKLNGAETRPAATATQETQPVLLKGHTAAVRATVITPDGALLISGGDDKTIRLWSLPDGKFVRQLMDLASNYESVKGASYKGTDVYGRSITYTLPCGSPIPAGAVCVCNCVPGAISIPRNHSQKYSTTGVCTCDLICTCNTVCTCQSVGGGTGRYVSYWYPN